MVANSNLHRIGVFAFQTYVVVVLVVNAVQSGSLQQLAS